MLKSLLAANAGRQHGTSHRLFHFAMMRTSPLLIRLFDDYRPKMKTKNSLLYRGSSAMSAPLELDKAIEKLAQKEAELQGYKDKVDVMERIEIPQAIKLVEYLTKKDELLKKKGEPTTDRKRRHQETDEGPKKKRVEAPEPFNVGE